MLKKFRNLIPGMMVLLAATIFAATILPTALANAQAVSLQEQLAAQYKLVKMGSDTSGYSVVEEGTLLAIQKGGLLGVPYSDTSVQNNKYEGGVVKAPNAILSKGIGFGMKKFGKEQTTKLFAKGDKVYPTKIDVNLEKDQVIDGHRCLRHLQQNRSADLQQDERGLCVSQGIFSDGERGAGRGYDRDIALDQH